MLLFAPLGYLDLLTGEECEPEEHGGPLSPVLAVVGGEVEAHDEPHRGERAQQPKVPVDHVDHVQVGARGGRQQTWSGTRTRSSGATGRGPR